MPHEMTGTVPEVVEEVKKQIDALGDNQKRAIEGLTKSHEDFKAELNKAMEDGQADAAEVKAKLDKHITEICGRVEDIQKKATERMDMIETRMVATPNGSMIDVGGTKEEHEEARNLKAYQLSRVNPNFDEKLLDDANVEELRNYKANFRKLLRKGKDEGAMSREEIKALSVGTDPEGGYFVPPQVLNNIYSIARESSPLRAMATVVPISSDSAKAKIYINVL